MTINIMLNSIILALFDQINNFFYWPVWWYSRGLLAAAKFCGKEITDQQERLGLSIWVKNIFTPMYGQYDIEGRIISFFVRLVQIIIRSILLLVWSLLLLGVFVVWIILPVFIIYEIYQYFI
jgi:hypothetical protein